MNIIIADDHQLFREMCQEYITRKRPNINVFTAKDYDSAVKIIDTISNIDLVILDLCMPGMDGIKGIHKMYGTYPHIPIAIISGVARKEDVDACINAGAKGFFSKTLSGQALISAIELVFNGETFSPVNYQSPPELRHSTKSSPQDVERALADANICLTKREYEILSFLVKGTSNQDIADTLGLKLVTVKLHVSGACRKLNAKNRTQAALRAKELGVE